MSDTVLIVIALALLVAVVLALVMGGRFRGRSGDHELSAEGPSSSKSRQTMKATGAGSSIHGATQVAEGSGRVRQEIEARKGGQLRDVDMRRAAEPSPPADGPPAAPTEPPPVEPPAEPHPPRSDG